MNRHILRLVIAGWLIIQCGAVYAQLTETRPVSGEFVRLWQVCGPFASRSLLDPVADDEGAVSPATHPSIDGRSWKVVRLPTNQLDFGSADLYGPSDFSVALAYAEIQSDEEGDLMLGLGSDDAVAAWWNGRQVLVQDVLRGLKEGEDQVVLHMNKGKNTLLLKVYNAGGGWMCAADLRPATDRKWSWRAVLPLTDSEFLDMVERKAFDYFWQEVAPESGLNYDSAPAGAQPNRAPCSVAAFGFGLSAICIGDSRGWITHDEARARVLNSLRFMLERVESKNGFFYHFVDGKTGKRLWDCEVSSIDTALFLAGALTCSSYFSDPSIGRLVQDLYRRVDWKWMLNGKDTLSMGWMPESGFLKPRWDTYSELMILYLLGLGAPANALPPETWTAWKRPYMTYEGMTYVQAVPLFLHQYSHCWVDFRDRRDAVADYFKNSALATRAHMQFCLSLKEKYPAYSESMWGVTASKGPKGYMVWGGPPPTLEYPIDGSVVPCAAGGSLAFVPGLTLPVLREIYNKYPEKAWGRYGFLDAFNPNTGWVADGYIGIDVGAMLLMIENQRTGKVWEWFMDNPEIDRAMKVAGFKRTGRDLDKADVEYLRQLAKDTWACIGYFINPETGLPYDSSSRGEFTSVTNIGLYLAALAAAREMGFITPEEASARAAKVLGSVEKFPTWKGFAQCWHGTAHLKPAVHDPWVSVVDTGNLALSLAVAAQAFPELAGRCRKIQEAMDWAALYDPKGKQLYGGYDMVNQKLNPDWRVDALATDSRGAAFMAIASGSVPADLWSTLLRDMDQRHKVSYLKPGWQGGGLFMQYLTGIFVDEHQSLMGRSAANLAYANMRNADELGLPAWGWSACLDPAGGYLGWGKLVDDVVTPHASVLAIEDFPKEVVANLYAIERLGARIPWVENGKTNAFGFRDSVNVKTKQVASDYLVLDQSMLFLSLANFLENGLIRKWFYADPSVTGAVAAIDELAHPEGGPNVSVCEPGLGAIIAKPQVEKSLAVPKLQAALTLDGDLSDWPAAGRATVKYPDCAEFGIPPNKDRFEAQVAFAWDDECLYFAADVKEDELVCEAPAAEIFKDDGVELFVDPAGDGLAWGDPKDFQIGLSPSGPEGKPQIYAWFQKTVPPGAEVASKIDESSEGTTYVIEAKIPWAFLGVDHPAAGQSIRASPAFHTVNKARTSSAKINWSYIANFEKIQLGELKLEQP